MDNIARRRLPLWQLISTKKILQDSNNVHFLSWMYCGEADDDWERKYHMFIIRTTNIIQVFNTTFTAEFMTNIVAKYINKIKRIYIITHDKSHTRCHVYEDKPGSHQFATCNCKRPFESLLGCCSRLIDSDN